MGKNHIMWKAWVTGLSGLIEGLLQIMISPAAKIMRRIHIFFHSGKKIRWLLGIRPDSHQPPMIEGIIKTLIPASIVASESPSILKESRFPDLKNIIEANRHE